MKAIRVHELGDPAVMQVEEIAAPEPGDHQVVVRIQAAGVNPVDTYIRAGAYARKPELPYTPGIDGAGTVERVGAGVTQFQIGDRIYGGWPLSGTYAEMALYSADQIYPLPPQISFKQGAGIFVPYSTAYRALFLKGQAKPGDTVLIHGATGGVGLAATQLAVAAGIQVIGTGSTPEGRSLVSAQGASWVFDHSTPGYTEQILAATKGQGVSLILEMLADRNLATDLTLIAEQGRIVIIGNRGSIEINPRVIMAKEALITGLTLFNTPSQENTRIQAALQAGLRQGVLAPIVNREFLLTEAARAHGIVVAPGAQGNLVLIP